MPLSAKSAYNTSCVYHCCKAVCLPSDSLGWILAVYADICAAMVCCCGGPGAQTGAHKLGHPQQDCCETPRWKISTFHPLQTCLENGVRLLHDTYVAPTRSGATCRPVLLMLQLHQIAVFIDLQQYNCPMAFSRLDKSGCECVM